MYISIGNKSKGRGIELSFLHSEWANDSYTEFASVGFDIVVKPFYTVHLLALAVQDNHVALCIFNFQVVGFWRN